MALWSTATVNNLPDSSFLYVESGGSKDGEGKTTPRTLRHFPYRTADGAIDLPHLRNALARIPQSSLPADVKARLTAKAEKLLKSANQIAEIDASQFAATQGADGVLEITMYGRIGGWDISAQGVSQLLDANPGAKQIVVNLSSPGGSAFEGAAIRARLAAHPANVRINIDGLAASAASIVAMAGDEIHMAENALLMIHNAKALTEGGVADHQSAIAMLQAIDQGAASIYAARTKKSMQQITAMMDAETWLGAQQALDFGLVDQITPAKAAAQSWDLSEFKNPPQMLTPQKSKDKEERMPISAELAKRFNLAESATEAELHAAIDVALKPAPKTEAQDTKALVQEAVKAAMAASQVTAEGITEVHAQTVQAAVERFVSEGKIPPASRESAIKACGKTAQSLAACVEYWEQAPRVLPQPFIPRQESKDATAGKGGPMLAKMTKASGIDPKFVAQVLAEQEAN
jgi:ATP-dependent protease ClpP protease subunit